MRRIGITLWLVAIVFAASLSAVLLRTNLLTGPQARSSDPVSNGNLGSSTPPAKATAPASGPASAPAPAATPTVPPTSPALTPPTTAAGPDDFYQALQQIAQQLEGPDGSGRGGGSGFLAWYQQLEAASGRTASGDTASAWFRQFFPDRVHGEDANRTDALTCGPSTFSLRTCAGGSGSQG